MGFVVDLMSMIHLMDLWEKRSVVSESYRALRDECRWHCVLVNTSQWCPIGHGIP